MTMLNVVRPRKGTPNPLACLPSCRAVLFLVALQLLGQSWLLAGSPATACQTAGEVSGWDMLEHTLTLKSDSGDYSDFRYDDSTAFTNGEATFRPEELNIDDRLCVEALRPGAQQIASRVRVTSRAEIDGRDKRELLRWQSESLFGAVKALDAANHTITVSVSASSEVSVDATGSVAFWIMPAAAEDPADAIRGGWDRLVTGDAIYVRGERAPGTPNMRAKLIVSGGFRSFAGSLESMEPLNELVTIRDFRTGRSRPVHIFMHFYTVGKTTVAGARDRRLYLATIGDVKKGDSVLVFGRENKQTGSIDAFLLITGFSPGGILQPGAGQSSDWIFEAAGFGGSKP
jgi:hypothetical protein